MTLLPYLAGVYFVLSIGCSVYCRESCFECRDANGLCISRSYQCDGKYDCPRKEDEANCRKDQMCPYESHHRCSDSGECLELFQLCDDHKDCPNGEDEYYHCFKYGLVDGRGGRGDGRRQG